MSGIDKLSERSRKILKVVIREYIRAGRPLGSRRLSKIYHEGLSPATLRNEMSDLEEAGFLTQPHTSAGRIPTLAGYRFYVESLLGTQGLSTGEVKEIKSSLEKEFDPHDLMNKTSRLLSTYSNNIGIVLAPRISKMILKHIEFVRISDRKLLVIIVSKGGLVQHRSIRCEERLSQTELNQAGRYLVENFAGKTLLEIREALLELMSEEKALYDKLLKNALLLGNASLGETEQLEYEASEMFLEGTSRVIPRLDNGGLDRLMELLETLEEKNRLVKIINECLKNADLRPSVTIGLEEHIPGMQNWSLITSPYSYEQDARGCLGVLGPSRMQYERTISLVDFVAKLCGEILARR